jgi:hypothetical protein
MTETEKKVTCPKCGEDVYIRRKPLHKGWYGYYDEDIQTIEDLMLSDDHCQVCTPKVHGCFEIHRVDEVVYMAR